MSIQLYKVFEDVMLPRSAHPVPNQNRFRVIRQKYSKLVLMVWPNGRPCHLANQWLMEKSSSSPGTDTPTTYAGQITHILRFCYSRQLDIWDINDLLLKDFASYLTETMKISRHGTDSARSINHVKAIQQRTLNFLLYISRNVPCTESRRLIGKEGQGCQITVDFRVNTYTGKTYIHHPYFVTEDPKPYHNDKIPMPDEFIQLIQNDIFRRHNLSELPDKSKLKQINDPDRFRVTNEYLFERRMFVIRMMKLAGLRPEELINIPLELNTATLTDLFILIPTMKREKPAPLRKFYISRHDALAFNRYVKARTRFKEFLEKTETHKSTSNAILLTESGTALRKESITKEFARLCTSAGITDSRACLSMFRHRFISREIHILLLEAFEKTPSLKEHWTEAFRDDICHKVARKTGHANAESIWVYFHEEYKLTTGRPDREKMIRNRDRIDSCHESLVYLKMKQSLSPSQSTDARIEHIENLIDQLCDDLDNGNM